jgi:CheY-like chemotaxis protein
MLHPVLIAEDSVADFFLANRAFARALSPVSLFHADDGADAIAYLQGEAPYRDRKRYPLPHVLVTDLKMPRIDGFELIEWMRQHERFKTTPIVVISNSNEPEDQEREKNWGHRNTF